MNSRGWILLHWGLPHYNSLLIWCKVNKVLDGEILLLGVREYALALLQHHSTSTMTRYVRCCRQRTHCGHPRSKTRPSFKDIHLFTLLLLPILLTNLQSAIVMAIALPIWIPIPIMNLLISIMRPIISSLDIRRSISRLAFIFQKNCEHYQLLRVSIW